MSTEKEQAPGRELPQIPSNIPPLYTQDDLDKIEAAKKSRAPEDRRSYEQWREDVLNGVKQARDASTPASRRREEKSSSPDSSARLHSWARSRGPSGGA